MKRIATVIGLGLLIGAVFAPAVVPVSVAAQEQENVGSCIESGQGLVPCGCDTTGPDGTGPPDGVVSGVEQCSFSDLMGLVKNVLSWLIVVSIPVSAALFAWAGVLYLIAGGDENRVQSANAIMRNVGIGLVLLLGSWVIVWTVATVVFDDQGQQYLQFLEQGQ